MKCILRGYGMNMTPLQKQNMRAQAIDLTRMRGTSMQPQAPRDVVCQAGPQGLLVTWNYPSVNGDIQRWRVYKADENTLHEEIKDRGTRQSFINATNGVALNVFVSSVNAAGIESPKTHGSGTPGTSTASIPAPPPEYNEIDSGGADTSTDYQ